MSVVEQSGLMKYKDKNGNVTLMYPITKSDNVDGLNEAVEEAKVLATAVSATSTDGVAYTATVPGITELTAGLSFMMVPDKQSTSRSTTLDVNGLGAKNLRVHVSGYTGTSSSPMTANWLAPNKPVRVTYDGMWWMADVVLPSAQQLYGNVKAEDVDYTNTTSGLTATKVQAAIDELAGGALNAQVLTTAEYNALKTKNANTLYALSDDKSESTITKHVDNTYLHVTGLKKTTWDKSVLLTNAAITLPMRANWRSVCYGGGKFVTAAYNGNIAAYSSDGITWTQTTMPVIAKWSSIRYGGGKFVAVSYGSTVAAYSDDGITWTQTTLPTSANWISVCYGGDKFVAVTDSSDLGAYSSDGITWTQMTLPANVEWQSVCYGGDRFVAVTCHNNVAAYSTDGITWAQTTLPMSMKWYSVCYGGGKFVTVGKGIENNNTNVAAYSTDGITWTKTTMPVYTRWQSVCYGGDKFVAVVDGGYYYDSRNTVAAYSTDGITWKQSSIETTRRYWGEVCYGEDRFVATGYSYSNSVAYSTNGTTWNTLTDKKSIENTSGVDISEDLKTLLGAASMTEVNSAIQSAIQNTWEASY